VSDVIQVRSEDLEEIQKTFARQEEAIGEMRGNLVRMNDKLKQGWIGLGSEAYFAEAEEKVLPAVQRLQEALGEAGHALGEIHEHFGAAEQEAAAPIRQAEAATGAGQAAGAAQAGQAAAAAQQAAGQGGGQGGAARGAGTSGAPAGAGSGLGGSLRSDLLGNEHLASRLQNSGFGSLGDLRNRGLDRLGSSLSEYEPREWSSSLGSSLGSGSGGGGSSGSGGGSAGGGGSLGSILGTLRGQADAGFGLGGSASGRPPDISYSGLGGFGGPGGPRPADFGLPIAIAAVSPFAALFGKVMKDRSERR
jgi:WXG100 family type VII secretion target